VHGIAPQQLVFVEPFVLFNFGQGPTTLPGTNAGRALSFHSYALDLKGEEGVLAYGVAAAERDLAPALVTEFGATTDAAVLNRLTGELEQQLLPWMDWSYDGSIIADPTQPAGLDNLRNAEAFGALARPYPVAVTGTPTRIVFDPITKVFDLAYDAHGPDGASYGNDLVTVVSLPARHYAGGYNVDVQGAQVTSPACALSLTLRTLAGADRVSLEVLPANAGCGAILAE